MEDIPIYTGKEYLEGIDKALTIFKAEMYDMLYSNFISKTGLEIMLALSDLRKQAFEERDLLIKNK